MPFNPIPSVHFRPSMPALLPMVAMALLLAGCSSVPENPPPELAAARSAVGGADPVTVGRYAAVEMRNARERLDAAEAAWREERGTTAVRFAEQALATVRLAEARARLARAETAEQDVTDTLETLEGEMRRDAIPPNASTSPQGAVSPPGR